jgi:hypothetical protein
VVSLHHLHEADPLVIEVPEHTVEELRGGLMVRIDDEHDVTRRALQAVVDLAGLRAADACAVDPVSRRAARQLLQRRVAAAVEQVCAVRVTHVAQRGQRALEHLHGLAGSGRGEDIHGEPGRAGRRAGICMPARNSQYTHDSKRNQNVANVSGT